MQDPDLRTSWEKATPLNSAVDRFIQTELVNASRTADELLSKPTHVLQQLSQRTGLSNLENNGSAMCVAAAVSLSTIAAPDHSLKKIILQWILDGTLVAMGYPLPRNHGDEPVVLEKDVWAGHIDWNRSEVSGNGLHYASVRLAAPYSQKQTARPKVGRPSTKQAVGNVWVTLYEADLIDLDLPQNHFFPLVREHLVKKFPAKAARFKDLSDKTIHRHTKDLHAAAKGLIRLRQISNSISNL